MRWLLLRFLLPGSLLMVLAVWPLATGSETLILRDVLNAHLPMKAFAAEAIRHGELPLVDPNRAGGQALVGNLNSAPLYPTNLLFALGSTLWAFNAHFWLHWLLAPWAMYWLARAWGYDRVPAWAAGVAYGLSGWMVSQLNFYNVVAGAALAPALVAAWLECCREASRRRGALAAALLWALLLLGGDPMLAAGAGLAALGAVVLRSGRALPWRRLAGAVACGTLIAAPQIVESARILDLSFRGHWGYGAATLVGSWDPRSFPSLLWPFFFGRPDIGGLWGHRFWGGEDPLFLTLYPGLLVLALAITAGRPRDRATAWAWGLIALGLVLATAGLNPLLRRVFALPVLTSFRFPVKFWLLVAIGVALLVAAGTARLVTPEGRRLAQRALAALAVFFALAWVVWAGVPAIGHGLLRSLIPEKFGDGFVARTQSGLAVQSLFTLAVLASGWLCVRRTRRLEGLAVAVLLGLHVASQLVMLKPCFPFDAAATYSSPPALLSAVPADAVLVYGHMHDLFGPPAIAAGSYPDPHIRWTERFFHDGLYPFAGLLAGRRYEFDFSPEGLDPFVIQVVGLGMEHFTDPRRLAILAATGVDRLIVDRPLGAEVATQVREVHSESVYGVLHHVYALERPLREVELASEVLPAPHMNAALEIVWRDGFDPRRMAVVAGEGLPRFGAPGTARLVVASPERLAAEVDSPDGGLVVFRRAFLPLYRATVDGAPAAKRIANLTRLAVEVPPGRHRVEVAVDRRPFEAGLAASAIGLVGLVPLAGRRRRDATIAPPSCPPSADPEP